MKKKFLLLVIFNLSLFSSSLFDFGSDSALPPWLIEYKKGTFEKDDGKHLYFIGISQSYSQREEKKALQGARNNGLSQISNYINVSVGTILRLKTVSKNDTIDESVDSDISSISFADLDSILPFKEYVLSKNSQIIGYTLYKLTRAELEEKKEEYNRKAKKYETKISKCKEYISTNKIDSAKEMLAELKRFKQSKYDSEITVLEKRIEKMLDITLTNNIVKGKKFQLNEYVTLTIRPSKSVYVYVLHKYGNAHRVKMLFPNEHDDNNYLNAKSSKTLKVKMIRKYLTNTSNDIMVIASYKRIPFINYINDNYELSSKKDAKWRNMLDDIFNSSKLFQRKLSYQVSNRKERKSVVCIKMEGIGILNREIVKESKSILKKSMKVDICNRAEYIVTIYYEETVDYEEALEQKIRTIVFSYTVEKGRDEIYASDEINERFSARTSKNEMMKELRTEMREIVIEMKSTIKDSK